MHHSLSKSPESETTTVPVCLRWSREVVMVVVTVRDEMTAKIASAGYGSIRSGGGWSSIRSHGMLTPAEPTPTANRGVPPAALRARRPTRHRARRRARGARAQTCNCTHFTMNSSTSSLSCPLSCWLLATSTAIVCDSGYNGERGFEMIRERTSASR